MKSPTAATPLRKFTIVARKGVRMRGSMRKAGLTSRLTALEARQPVIAERVALLTLDGQMLSQEIALTKALGGGYRADPPVELKPR